MVAQLSIWRKSLQGTRQITLRDKRDSVKENSGRLFLHLLPDLGNRPDNRRGFRTINCPLEGHSDNDPSFGVNLDEGYFNCLGCGVRGDVITLYMRLTGRPFPESVDALDRIGDFA